ncbi:MAG: hypothetical protein MJZ12_05745, partial [Prevotella sp.]|nr:hypothetical protein [Prevotella sp.]
KLTSMRKILIFITLLSCCAYASAQTSREWRDSVSYLSQLIEQNPKSLELRMRKAEANIALEQWQYALDEYSNILDLYPTHLGALYFRGYVNDKLKRYSFARQDYEQVLRYAPDHEGAITGLILVNLSDNRLLNAFDESNHLVELYPDHSSSYALRAQVEDARGMTELAIDDISKSIELEQDKLPSDYKITLNDPFTIYVLHRIELYAKMKKKKYQALAEVDRELLISKGIPSAFFMKKK